MCLTASQWERAFKGEFPECTGGGKGLHTETAWSALTGILKLVMWYLTSVVLTVSSAVGLQFQGQFVPLSLRAVLKVVAASVTATARFSRR